MKISFEEVKTTFESKLLQAGFSPGLAGLNAEIFAKSTLDGYHSHGVNRFAEFVRNIRKGVIKPEEKPVLSGRLGPIHRFDGLSGPGPSNAHYCMSYAIKEARKEVLACVALQNTNHWMRGGSYGWQAAEAGCISLCFTNTMPNMPPWGGTTVTTGNNPLIASVPNPNGHIVLDMSLSQFSYGKMYEHRLEGKRLPFAGGFNQKGILTDDPSEIIESRRILQTGYWKGSGLSLILDLLASLISNGKSTSDIGKLEAETGLSQVFICIDSKQLSSGDELSLKINDIIEHFKSSIPQQEDRPIRYPGEATAERREKQRTEGILIDDQIWNQIMSL